jgi:hypothetical protein
LWLCACVMRHKSHCILHLLPAIDRWLSEKCKLTVPPCNKRACPINHNTLCYRHRIVYSITCQTCHSEYIGSTTRYFHDRAQEHLRHTRHTSVHDHSLHCRNTPSSAFLYGVLSQQHNNMHLRLAEGLLIASRQPTINRRQEVEDAMAFVSHYTRTQPQHWLFILSYWFKPPLIHSHLFIYGVIAQPIEELCLYTTLPFSPLSYLTHRAWVAFHFYFAADGFMSRKLQTNLVLFIRILGYRNFYFYFNHAYQSRRPTETKYLCFSPQRLNFVQIKWLCYLIIIKSRSSL